MTIHEYNNLQTLSQEQLIKIIEDYKHKEFLISEVLVDESKSHYDSQYAIDKIRCCLSSAPQYKFYDEHLGNYVDLQLGKISMNEYVDIILGEE